MRIAIKRKWPEYAKIVIRGEACVHGAPITETPGDPDTEGHIELASAADWLELQGFCSGAVRGAGGEL